MSNHPAVGSHPAPVAARSGELTGADDAGRLLALQRDLLLDGIGAGDSEAALQAWLRRIGEFAGLPVGHALVAETPAGDRLVSANLWYLSDPQRFAGFQRVAADLRLEGGSALPGRAWKRGQLELAADLAADDSVLRAVEAGYCGLRTGFALPLLSAAAVVAVLEFYAETDIEVACPGPLHELLQSLARPLGALLAQKQELRQLARLSQAAEQSPAMVFIIDSNARLVYVNPRVTTVSGYSAEELLGQTTETLLSGLVPQVLFEEIWQEVRAGKPWQGGLHCRKHNGDTYWVDAWLSMLPDPPGPVGHCIGWASPISAQEPSNQRIERLAFYDALTGLPNQAYFQSQLKRTLARCARDQRGMALLVIDLDDFESVNLLLGHDAGDEMLQRVASRLQAVLRESDLLARLGGDEFATLVEIGCDSSGAAELAIRTIDAVGKRYQLDGRELSIEVSVGISVFPEDGTDPEQLLGNARRALTRGKGRVKGQYHFYAAELDARVRDRKALEMELRGAIAEEQFRLWYQPQVEASTRLIKGAEALIRWQHPQRGLLPPSEIIPLAEDSGLIVNIGAWALRRACAQLAEWREMGLPTVNVVVNLSAVQFRHEGLIATVREAIESFAVNPADLTLEITESVMMEGTESNVGILKDLRSLGVQVSLDDFGTGYSSLSYLTRFPVDKIKIDRSFVARVLHDPVHLAVVDAVVRLGRELGATINVEGVETQAQYDLLCARQIDEIQGFYFSKPVPAEEFGELLLLNQMVARDA